MFGKNYTLYGEAARGGFSPLTLAKAMAASAAKMRALASGWRAGVFDLELEAGRIARYRVWLCASFDGEAVVFDSSRPDASGS